MIHFDDTDSEEAKIFIEYEPTFSTFRLSSDVPSVVDKIIENYTIDNPSYYYCQQAGNNYVEDRISPFGRFGDAPIGLLPSVIRETKERYPKYDFVFEDVVKRDEVAKKLYPLRGISNIKSLDDIIQFDNEDFEFRGYQIECVQKALNRGRGLISSPTSSGKSFIIATIILNMVKNENIRKVCFPNDDDIMLILVPGIQLVHQMYKDLLASGIPSGWLTRFTSDIGKKRDGTFVNCSKPEKFNRIVVTNRNWLSSGHSKDLPHISAIICDEVHTVKPKGFSFKFVKSLDTNIRIGFSGTIPDSYNRWMMEGQFSEVFFREKITHLQDCGYITKLRIEFVKMFDNYVASDRNILFNEKSRRHYDENDCSEDAITVGQAFQEELAYLSKNAIRLYQEPFKKIFETSKDKNTLVLFDRLEMGSGLVDLCGSLWGKDKVHYVDGTVDVASREKIRTVLEGSFGNVLVAQSVTTSTGWNVKNLDNMVFCFSGKSSSKIIQSIGRTLRLRKGKDVATLFDVSFNFKYSQRHLSDRIQIYKDAYGDYEKHITSMTVPDDSFLL